MNDARIENMPPQHVTSRCQKPMANAKQLGRVGAVTSRQTRDRAAVVVGVASCSCRTCRHAASHDAQRGWTMSCLVIRHNTIRCVAF